MERVYKVMVKPAVLPGVTGMLRSMGQWTSKVHADTRTEQQLKERLFVSLTDSEHIELH